MKLKGDESKVFVESFESYQTFSQDWDTFFTFCYLSVVRGQAVPIRSRGAIGREGMVLRTVSQTPWLCLPNQDRWLTLAAAPPACQAHGLIRLLLLSVISSFVLQISIEPILRVRHGSRGWEHSGIGQKGPQLWQHRPGEKRARKQDLVLSLKKVPEEVMWQGLTGEWCSFRLSSQGRPLWGAFDQRH